MTDALGFGCTVVCFAGCSGLSSLRWGHRVYYRGNCNHKVRQGLRGAGGVEMEWHEDLWFNHMCCEFEKCAVLCCMLSLTRAVCWPVRHTELQSKSRGLIVDEAR